MALANDGNYRETRCGGAMTGDKVCGYNHGSRYVFAASHPEVRGRCLIPRFVSLCADCRIDTFTPIGTFTLPAIHTTPLGDPAGRYDIDSPTLPLTPWQVLHLLEASGCGGGLHTSTLYHFGDTTLLRGGDDLMSLWGWGAEDGGCHTGRCGKPLPRRECTHTRLR